MPRSEKRIASAHGGTTQVATAKMGLASLIASGVGYLGDDVCTGPTVSQSIRRKDRSKLLRSEGFSQFKLFCLDQMTGDLHFQLPELTIRPIGEQVPVAPEDLAATLIAAYRHVLPHLKPSGNPLPNYVVPIIEHLGHAICGWLASARTLNSCSASSSLRTEAIGRLASAFTAELADIPATDPDLLKFASARRKIPVMFGPEKLVSDQSKERVRQLNLLSAFPAKGRSSGKGRTIDFESARGRLSASLLNYMVTIRGLHGSMPNAVMPDVWNYFVRPHEPDVSLVNSICELSPLEKRTAVEWVGVATSLIRHKLPGGLSHPDVIATGQHHGRFELDSLSRQLAKLFLALACTEVARGERRFRWFFLDPSDLDGSTKKLRQFRQDLLQQGA